jgi:release factor glutamine methyltransferase
MSASEAWTVGRLLTWTTDYLKKNGSESPRLDAEVLLAKARGCQRIELYTAFNEEPDETTRSRFKEMVRRRAEGTPVAYLVGSKEFYSLPFEVAPEVLIPRPETEHLVVEAIDRAKEIRSQRMPSSGDARGMDTGGTAATQAVAEGHATDPPVAAGSAGSAAARGATGAGGLPAGAEAGLSGNLEEELPLGPRPRPVVSFAGLRIADVGTGSGIIAVSLARSLPGAQVTAVDVSPAALEIAKRNVARHEVGVQVSLVESDLLSAVPEARFDLIVSNPPYVSEAEYASLAPSVRKFEPKLALVADGDGTAIIQRLLEQAAVQLVPGGYLLFELSPMIVERVVAGVDRTQWGEPHVTKDLAGHQRIVTLKRL